MLNLDEFKTIQTLALKGHSIKKIAKLTGHSRNTVRKYLRSGEEPAAKSSEVNPDQLIRAENSQWHDFHNEILVMLEKQYCGSRIYNELEELGASGKPSSFYDYLRTIRAKSTTKARARFETAPGDQAQWDWAEYKVKLGGRIRRIYVYQTILSYSRYRHATASLDCTQASLTHALTQAFEFFGGCPHTGLMDNGVQMVANANRSQFRWNPKFLQCMAHYDIEPVACQVGHSWTKGKVENPFRYLEQHFIKGNEFDSLEDLNCQLIFFVEKVNHKYHQGINTQPIDLFEEEKPLLKPLPAELFVYPFQEKRKVRNDALIQFQGNQYSVPYPFALKTVLIRPMLGDRLEIYSDRGARIAVHQLAEGRGQRIIDSSHYQGLIEKYAPHGCESTFLKLFPTQSPLLEQLQNLRPKDWKRFLSRSLQKLDLYESGQVLEAINYCIQQRILTVNLLETYLGCNYDATVKQPTTLIQKTSWQSMDGVKRDITAYSMLFESGNYVREAS